MTNPEDNGASVASGNRSAFGYTLTLLWFYLFIMLNLVVQFVMIYIMVLIWKLPNTSTLPGSLLNSRPFIFFYFAGSYHILL
jgi:hypothetical protein